MGGVGWAETLSGASALIAQVAQGRGVKEEKFKEFKESLYCSL